MLVGRLPLSALALAAVFASGSRVASAQERDPGPPIPGTRSLYLLDIPFLHFGPQDVVAPRAGTFSFDVEMAYSNTFSHTWHAKAIHNEFGTNGHELTRDEMAELHLRHPQDFIAFVDGEVTRVALRGIYGISDRFSLAIELPYISFGVLHLDSAIEAFHGAIGLYDGERLAFPRGRFFIIRQREWGAVEYEDRQPTAGLGDATASLRYRDRLQNGMLLSADATFKLPTGSADNYRGSGSLDAGLLAGALRRFGTTQRWGLRLEGGVVIPGRFLGNTPTTLHPTVFMRLFGAADVRLGRQTFLALSAALEESPFQDKALNDEAQTALDLTLGLTHRFGTHVTARLSLTENVSRMGDAADISVSLGLKYVP
jgi:Protein of unknown function (DUF3187)